MFNIFSRILHLFIYNGGLFNELIELVLTPAYPFGFQCRVQIHSWLKGWQSVGETSGEERTLTLTFLLCLQHVIVTSTRRAGAADWRVRDTRATPTMREKTRVKSGRFGSCAQVAAADLSRRQAASIIHHGARPDRLVRRPWLVDLRRAVKCGADPTKRARNRERPGRITAPCRIQGPA